MSSAFFERGVIASGVAGVVVVVGVVVRVEVRVEVVVTDVEVGEMLVVGGGVGRESRTAGQNMRSSSISKDFAERKALYIIV